MSWEEEKAELLATLEREREFRAFMLNEIPYLVMTVGQAGDLRIVNPVLLKLIGKKLADIQGMPWKNLLHEEDRQNIQYVVADDGNVSFQARLLCPNNDVRLVEWNVLNHKLAVTEPEATAFMLSGRDITAQMEFEKQEGQRQKLEALGHLAGGVAHEMNNLLQPIIMSAHMMQPTAEGENNAQYIKHIDRILRNAGAASKIVQDILLYSRDEAKEISDLNVIDIIQKSIDFVCDMLPATISVESNFDAQSKSYIANVNETDMIQLITNMLINAAHSMQQEGTVKITSKVLDLTAKKAVHLEIPAGQYLRIDIEDEGCGIEKTMQDRIFDPFFTTKQPGEGTGLGLSIVYKIIRDWKGTITVESEINRGSTFSIYIPVKKE